MLKRLLLTFLFLYTCSAVGAQDNSAEAPSAEAPSARDNSSSLRQSPRESNIQLSPMESQLLSLEYCVGESDTGYIYVYNVAYTIDNNRKQVQSLTIQENNPLVYDDANGANGFSFTTWRYQTADGQYCKELLMRIWNYPRQNFRRIWAQLAISRRELVENPSPSRRSNYTAPKELGLSALFEVTLLETPPTEPPSATPCPTVPAPSTQPEDKTQTPSVNSDSNTSGNMTQPAVVVVAVFVAVVVLCLTAVLIAVLNRQRRLRVIAEENGERGINEVPVQLQALEAHEQEQVQPQELGAPAREAQEQPVT